MSGPLARRDFIKGSLTVAATATVLATERAHGATADPAVEAEWRNRQAGMRYRRLGRTGFMVSEIVQGGDPVSPDNRRHVEMAVERGLNYLDTAPVYAGGKSEPGYAEVLKAVGRDNVFVTTKVSALGGARNRAYQEVFAGLTRRFATVELAGPLIHRRRTTLRGYESVPVEVTPR